MSHQRLHEIRKEVAKGNVYERAEGDLSIFKYTQACDHDKKWNKTNMRCRGIVFNTKTGTIVARPFDKFFNAGERPNVSLKVLRHKLKKQSVEAYEKLDGSCCAIWHYNGRWHCSTPGSITSPQAKYARLVLLPKYDLSKLPTDITYVCELIAPVDRQDKVVDYGNRNDLTLLAAFENKWELTEIPRNRLCTLFEQNKVGIKLAQRYPLDPSDPFATSIPDGEEGFILRFEDGTRVKMKSTWYRHWARIISGMTPNNVADMLELSSAHQLRRELTPHSAPAQMKERLNGVIEDINAIKEEILDEVDDWWVQVEDLTNHKACAELFKQAGPLQHILFARMRGNSDGEHRALWKRIKTRIQEKNKAFTSRGQDNQEQSKTGS